MITNTSSWSLCSCSNKSLNTVEPPVPPRSPSDLLWTRKSCVHRLLRCNTHATCDNNPLFCDSNVSAKNHRYSCPPCTYTTFHPFLPSNFFSISSQNHRPDSSLITHHSLTLYLTFSLTCYIIGASSRQPEHRRGSTHTHQPSKPYGRSKNPMRLRSEIRL
jgi:hypothetical protein